MGDKLRVGVVFGGRSAEHEVSLVSAASIINALDKEKYEIVPIGITPEGRWLSAPDALSLLREKTNIDRFPEHVIVPNPQRQGLVSLNWSLTSPAVYHVDVLFPVLHGPFGEDGTIQGLFELAGIPYVGAGVLGSAIGMDKVIQKQLLQHAKILTAPGLWFQYSDFVDNQKELITSIERRLRYPCFVKPANLGSSVGISKARNRSELLKAVRFAGEYDRKILVEKGIEKAREIECSVLGNERLIASVPGEIIPSNEFYDYDAKYVDGKSKSVVPAKLPKNVVRKIRDMSVHACAILNCEGMARVDFLVTGNGTRVYLNEINTIPGFTSISMYPKLWEASGIPYPELLDRLITLALERHNARKNLKTVFAPKTPWYKRP